MTLKNNITKSCMQCQLDKNILEFHINNKSPDKRKSICKYCANSNKRRYLRTKFGITSDIYSCQFRTSRDRGHDIPNYTIDEFRVWAFSQEIFHQLYKKWVESGYNKMLRPSFDRTDDSRGYSLDRLTIMTWQENKNKFNINKADLRLNKGIRRKVIQMTLSNDYIKTFKSLAQAHRETGVHSVMIGKCCKGRLSCAGKFNWMFSI